MHIIQCIRGAIVNKFVANFVAVFIGIAALLNQNLLKKPFFS